MKTIRITFRDCPVDVVLRDDGGYEYWTYSAALLLCSEADRAEMRRLAGLS